jgi:hypothetical protein
MSSDVIIVNSNNGQKGIYPVATGAIVKCPVPKLSSTNFISEGGVDVIYYIEPAPRAEAIRGCLDPTANNYNPYAQESSGDCIWLGCTDTGAINYNEKANTDDGSCIGKTWVEEPNIDVPDYYVPLFPPAIPYLPLTKPNNEGVQFIDFCSYCGCCFVSFINVLKGEMPCADNPDAVCFIPPYTLSDEELLNYTAGSSRDTAIALAAQGLVWDKINTVVIGGVEYAQNNLPEDIQQVYQNMIDNYERDKAAFEEDQARIVEQANIRDLINQGATYEQAVEFLHPISDQNTLANNNYQEKVNFLIDQLGATREQAESIVLNNGSSGYGLTYDNIKDAIISGSYFGQGLVPVEEFLQNVADNLNNDNLNNVLME